MNNSETIDGLTDEVYLVIKTNGTVVFYDYMGDSFDAEANLLRDLSLYIIQRDH